MSLLRWLPRFRQAYNEMGILEARESWLRSTVEAFQVQRINSVWAHAIAHVPYYRTLARTHSLPTQFEDLEQYQTLVPVLPKDEVRENYKEFLSERSTKGWWTRTGGSTGNPMNCYWGKEAHLESLRGKYRFLSMWGIDIFDRTAFLWGHSSSLKPGFKGWLARRKQPVEDWLRRRLRMSAYQLGQQDLQTYLQQIVRFQPKMLYGYSRAISLLAREAEKAGVRCDSLKLVLLTGEPAFPHLVEQIERVFGVPAVGEYGSVECGFLAGEKPDRSLMVREDMAYLETQRRDDGRFDILVSILNNPSFPLLRYAIGDVTDAPLEKPERGFARLSNVAGRNNDLIVSRLGRQLHSARFDAMFKYDTDVIRGFRVRQHSDGSLTVKLELDDPTASLDLELMRTRLSELVDGYPVTIEVVDALPQTPAGKHRLVLSDLDVANQSLGTSKEQIANGNGSQRMQNGDNGNGHRAPPVEPETKKVPSKASKFAELIRSPQLTFLMEAHNGLSAKIVEEAGFEAIWASGLSISAALGVRDSNEASWTQVLEVLEFMSDNTSIPILVDGDTGYGNFNNMRRLVRKLEQRGIGGVCIEDKLFPKTNSFIKGTSQPLAEVDEFCGRIKAGKDAQLDDDFVIVARVEAFIAGWGLEEALRRAEAYHEAGADAILMHSSKSSAEEVIAFKEEWGDRHPVVIVPTKYYTTPTDVFRKHRFSAVIWANHLMRSCITTMQRIAQQIHEEQSLVRIEEQIAAIHEVFRLQGQPELAEAEKRYLPQGTKAENLQPADES